MSDERIKKKIRKLLAMAGSNSPQEAAIAARQAAALMRKYQLDHADVIAEEIARDGVGDVWVKVSGKETPTWMGVIALGVARLCEVGATTRGGSVRFIGYGPDRELAEQLLLYIIGQCNAQAKVALAKAKAKAKAEAEQYRWRNMALHSPRRWAGDFRSAFATEVQRRMKQMARENEASDSDVANALAVAKQNAIAAICPRSLTSRRTNRTYSYSSSGAGAGREAGRKASLRLAAGGKPSTGPALLTR